MARSKSFGIAGLVLSSLAIAVLSGGTSKAKSPTIPTEPPKPRPAAKTVQLTALHSYEFVADVLPVGSLASMEAIFPLLGLAPPSQVTELGKGAKRNGQETHRIRFTAHVLLPRTVELEREQAYAGLGSVWIVSAVDKGPIGLGG